jgi:NAD(P)-dependent dehydrogenase (short-subunit alcohol dehydrogenase family)
MRVMVVGATGTIGRAVVTALSEKHESSPPQRHRFRARRRHRPGLPPGPVRAGRAYRCGSLYGWSGCLQAAEGAHRSDFELGLRSKLMAQVNLVRQGLNVVHDGGSFTVTSGTLGTRPSPCSAAFSTVNAGVEGFVRAAAALEMPRGIRINAVSPDWVAETLAAMGRDPATGRDASTGVPVAKVARAFVACVEGRENGTVLEVVRDR